MKVYIVREMSTKAIMGVYSSEEIAKEEIVKMYRYYDYKDDDFEIVMFGVDETNY